MYKNIFNDYDSTLPKLAGFIDDSWHNDSCPSMYNQEKYLKLFVDYESPALRAYELPRFNLYLEQNNGDAMVHLLSTESIEELEAFLNQY